MARFAPARQVTNTRIEASRMAALQQQGFCEIDRVPNQQPRLSAEYRIGRPSSRYRIGMTMHNLPETIFWAKDARHA